MSSQTKMSETSCQDHSPRRTGQVRGWSSKVAGWCLLLTGMVASGTAVAGSPYGIINDTRSAAPGTPTQPVADGAQQPTPPVRAAEPRVAPFGPKQTRMPRMAGPAPIGSTPRPTPEVLKEYAEFVKQVVDPQNTLDLVVGRARLMVLKDPPKRVQISDDSIANFAVVSPSELSLLGKSIGSTVLTLWFADPQDATKLRILSYLVRVIPDPEVKERLERIYKALEEEVNHAFPDSRVSLSLVGDKTVVCGQAKDVAEATQIIRIIAANVPPVETAQIPVNQLNVTLTPGEGGPDGSLPQALQNYIVPGATNIINLLRVPGEQQVTLRCVVAEVSRSALRSIGVNLVAVNDHGIEFFANTTGNIAQTGLNNLRAALDNGQIRLAISALRDLHYARLLAEPNLTTLNGQPATFQAGGQFPVPVVTGFTAAGLQGVNFVNFGVQLSFTPFITDKDRVRLAVAADVSAINTTAGTTNINGALIPSLNTRNFQTTVELREGQTLAVAGLIENNLDAFGRRIPFFGDLPVVGRLAGFDQITADEKELVILITPELVHPLEAKEVPPLPGADLYEPGDLEFYLLGRLESRREYDYRSPVMTDIERMKGYRHCERLYIRGPHGHCDTP